MSHRFCVGDGEERKLKRKIQEASTMSASSELLPPFCSGSKKMVGESSSLKVNGVSGFAPKYVENSNDQVIKHKKDQFPCKHCDKKFPTYQALGGHQKAHKSERVFSRMKNEFDIKSLGLGAHFNMCSTKENHYPFYESPFYQRVNMNPMEHMYGMSRPCFGLGYNTSLSGHHYGMTNSYGASTNVPQRLNQGDLGFGFELDHSRSLVGRDASNRVVAPGDFGGP